MNMFSKHHKRIVFRPGTETVVIWLVVAVVVPSLLLTLFSFWAMRRQEQLTQQAAQHRMGILLSEAEGQLQTKLEQLKAKFSGWAEEASASASTQTFADFSSQEALAESLFLLDAEGNVLLPQPLPSPPPMKLPDSREWETAQQYEFELKDLTQAVEAYQAIGRADDKLAPHAMNAVGRCAAKQGDFATAEAAYTRLLDDDLSIPTPLRLGAYYQLAQLKGRLGQSEAAAQMVVESVEWMAETSEDDDYQPCVYYTQQIRRLWETTSPAISGSIRKRWESAQGQWEERTLAYQFHAVLKGTILPPLWPSVVALPVGEAQYMSVQTPQGWQVSLVINLTHGGYFGSIVSLANLQDALLPPLNARLRQLGEGAEGMLITSDEAGPESPLAILRLAHPFSFWQLSVEPKEEASTVAHWQSRLIRWSVILCLGAILAGVYWIWRRIHQEQKLSRLKTDFVSNVSHELKTPLTSIRMFVETLMLKRYRSESDEEEYLNILQQEIERLARLVDRVLDFSRMERGRKQFDFAPGDLQAVVQETVEVFQLQMRENEEICEIHTQVAEDIPPILFDRDTIAEVLWNLMHNAVKYSHPPKQVSVKLEREGDTVTLAVQDNGIGIPKSEQKRIFERFYRVDDKLAREVQGSGLGLAMVKYIVEAHGGAISVESQPGEGSTFMVSLPVNGRRN